MRLSSIVSFASTLFVAGVLFVGCANAPTLGVVATDASSIVTTLQNVAAEDPALFGKNAATVTAALADAQGALAKVSSSTPVATGASVVQQVNGDINTVLDIAATLPVIPPPYDLAVGAAAALAPTVETWVDSALNLAGAVRGPKAWASLATPGMTPDQARAKLASLTKR